MPKRPKRVRKQRKTIDKDEKPSNWKEKLIKIMKNAWFYDCSVQWYHFNGKFSRKRYVLPSKTKMI